MTSEIGHEHGEQFPHHVLVSDDQPSEFAGGHFEELVGSHIVLLHSGVTKIVAGSASKRVQMPRLIEFKGSAVAPWAQQAETLATSARGHCVKLKT